VSGGGRGCRISSRRSSRSGSSPWRSGIRVGGRGGWRASSAVASSFACAQLVSCPHGNPTGQQTSKLAHRVAAELAQAGWRLERVLTDNVRSSDFRQTLDQLGVRHSRIRAGRPQTNGAVEALHRLILEECWRPAFARYLHVRFTGLQRDLATYIADYNYQRVHNGRLTRGRIPADIVYGANKMKTR
jgi:hypothetical protein